MFKNLTISALLLFSATAGLAQGELTLYRTIKDDYAGKADSMVNAFIESFMIKNKGVFNDKVEASTDNYGGQAAAITESQDSYSVYILTNRNGGQTLAAIESKSIYLFHTI